MSPSRRSNSRSRSSSRRPAPSNDNSTAIMVGVGVLVLAIVGYMALGSGGGKGNDAKAGAVDETKKVADTEKLSSAAGSSPGKAAVRSNSNAGKSGKSPTRAAPPLDSSLLAQCEAKLREADAMYRAAKKAQGDGDNDTLRAKGKQAEDMIVGIKDMLEGPLEWQDEAEMEDWAQPAEYVRLGKLWGKLAKLDKKARMISK